ncbi:hypothetical protein LVB77_14575 [Lysobacter sp. 5GHs7-4]|uniref:hypothetical protein n=1 Tax=Lysobacter sp. 5GHs7-4 TaxID=2904253 RepID=UPI001E419CFA|nr:hypothetical protein [Lysobacter sp. 5GHs7-4]UHQ21891.1 hypothetical protein LVB77_14575 [Lysobacter sp. 5GHs7-4]
MIHLFCGYEAREALGFHAFVASVLSQASQPVSIVPLAEMGLPRGSNAFTLSRFLVPFLTGYRGHAIFADASDMLVTADIAELDALFDPRFAVQVVQHPNYRTRHQIKYRGTALETINTEYARKNWASVMLINCEHPAWSGITPDSLAGAKVLDLLQLVHCDGAVGALPDCWNRLVDEGHPVEGAKLMHWTAGIPGFPAYQDAPGAEQWFSAMRSTDLRAAA